MPGRLVRILTDYPSTVIGPCLVARVYRDTDRTLPYRVDISADGVLVEGAWAEARTVFDALTGAEHLLQLHGQAVVAAAVASEALLKAARSAQ
jgi:hypothetical protein